MAIHPKQEVSRLICTCLGRESTPASVVGGDHSIKELSEQRVNGFSEHLRRYELATIICCRKPLYKYVFLTLPNN
jgi:hypothetical protein